VVVSDASYDQKNRMASERAVPGCQYLDEVLCLFAVVSVLSLDRIDITTSERAALGYLRGMDAWMGGWQTLIVYSV
jgi:hypothetical protein